MDNTNIYTQVISFQTITLHMNSIGSGVVLDCIDSRSLHPYLLRYRDQGGQGKTFILLTCSRALVMILAVKNCFKIESEQNHMHLMHYSNIFIFITTYEIIKKMPHCDL